MQDQQKFLEILTNPYQLDKNSLDFLQKISEQYPYSQSAQVLLAKNIQEFDKLEFEKQVNKASAYSIDRRKFQRYISGKDKEQSAKIPENQILSQVTDQNQKKQNKTGTKEKAYKQSLLEIVRKRLRDISERKQTDTKEPIQTEPKQDTSLTDISNKTENIIEGKEFSANEELTIEVDKNQLQQDDYPLSFAPERLKIYKRTIFEDTEENKKTENPEEVPEDQAQNIAQQKEEQINADREEATFTLPETKKERTEIQEDGNASPEVPGEKPQEQDIGELADKKEKIDQDLIKEETSKPFKENEKQKTENDSTGLDTEGLNTEIKTTEDDHKNQENTPIDPLQEKTNLKEKSFDRVKGLPRKKPNINELIDKFLKEEPRIKVKKDLPEKQEDLSAPSTSENPQIATETLANVYLKQGKKEKALDIYEKLCLKFPQKSSYFAKKIIEIKNELNS